MCKNSLSVPLNVFWHKCLSTGEIPKILKLSLITPRYKGESRSLSVNYRPVALISHIIKIFEKIIRNHLVAFLDENNLFNPNQHGFRKGRSCLSQLLDHFDTVISFLKVALM